MIKFGNNKLVIEIETSEPYDLLYELQTNLIKLLQLRDEHQQTDRMEVHYTLELLRELLPAVNDYKNIAGC